MLEAVRELYARVAGLERVVSNTVQKGTIYARDPVKGYRVKLGEADEKGNPIIGPWIKPHESGAGVKTWFPWDIGQPVAQINLPGDTREAAIIPIGYTGDHPPPSSSFDECFFEFKDIKVRMKEGEVIFQVGDETAMRLKGKKVTIKTKFFYQIGKGKIGLDKEDDTTSRIEAGSQSKQSLTLVGPFNPEEDDDKNEIPRI